MKCDDRILFFSSSSQIQMCFFYFFFFFAYFFFGIHCFENGSLFYLSWTRCLHNWTLLRNVLNITIKIRSIQWTTAYNVCQPRIFGASYRAISYIGFIIFVCCWETVFTKQWMQCKANEQTSERNVKSTKQGIHVIMVSKYDKQVYTQLNKSSVQLNSHIGSSQNNANSLFMFRLFVIWIGPELWRHVCVSYKMHVWKGGINLVHHE